MCDRSPYHQYILTQIKLTLESEELTPTEKKQLEEARKVYETNCTRCKKGASDDVCISMALDELLRMVPGKDKWKIYPWKNHNWSYGSFIDNNFSAAKTGSSPNGLLNNLLIFIKFYRAYVRDPNPGTGSIAGGTSMGDTESDYPVFCNEPNMTSRLAARFDVAKNSPTNDKPPYDDPFFNKPLAGVRASSYFVRVGSCPREDITDREECAKKNFEWKSDQCYQPRYAYMNNEPFPKRKVQGAVPSFTYSAAAMNTANIALAFTGKSNRRMTVQECPKVTKQPPKESFLDYYDPDIRESHIQFGINEALVIGMGIFIGYFFYDTFFSKRK